MFLINAGVPPFRVELNHVPLYYKNDAGHYFEFELKRHFRTYQLSLRCSHPDYVRRSFSPSLFEVGMRRVLHSWRRLFRERLLIPLDPPNNYCTTIRVLTGEHFHE